MINLMEEQSLWGKLENKLVRIITFLVLLAIIFIAGRHFLIDVETVNGNSMLPNFKNNDYILVNKFTLSFSQIKRSETVLVRNPKNPDQVLIKRVIALPGEKVKFSQGKVYINQELLREPYITAETLTFGGDFIDEEETKIIPLDHYFILGDNRNDSIDSRRWGAVHRTMIIGHTTLISKIYDILTRLLEV